MGKRFDFRIVSVEGEALLCFVHNETLYSVTDPSDYFSFDEVELVEPNPALLKKVYNYKGQTVRITVSFFRGGWLEIFADRIGDSEGRFVLCRTLEGQPALSIPAITFVDINNEPEALEFLVQNGFVSPPEEYRRSGFVNYPVVRLNLPLLYQHDPDSFQKSAIDYDLIEPDF